MPDFFRDQPKLRATVGAMFVVFVWALYVVRVAFGIGPIHDYDGNQAPTLHYLGGAIIVSAMVTVWMIVGTILTRRRRQREKQTK